jgi:2-C-methyl-D-erythritol 2,4-cyclodiphosphate synthase
LKTNIHFNGLRSAVSLAFLMFRIGNGYDVHRLVAGRKLILGGVEIPYTLGLEGHSDADLLTHAICDAILGALGAGDIGRYFPDTDPKWKGVSSLILLKQVGAMCREKKFTIANIDSIVAAQKPKIAPHINAMKQNIASALGIDPTQVNVKATTTETLGYVGREEGMAATAVVLLQKQE